MAGISAGKHDRKHSMVPSCEGEERELFLDGLGEEHGVVFGERAVTQRHCYPSLDTH